MNPPFPRPSDLLEAARTGRTEILLWVAADESLLHVADSNVNTPLLAALESGHLDLAEQLIALGANPFAMNHSDNWPMRTITRRNGLRADARKRLVEAVIATRDWEAEIFPAVWLRDRRKAAEVLRRAPEQAVAPLADPQGESGFYNTLPYCGLTPLHYAALAGDIRMARLLLDAGAEPDALPHAHEPDSPHTPLLLVPNGCKPLAQLLVDRGANVRHTAWYLNYASRAVREVAVAGGAAGTPFMAALCTKQFAQALEMARSDPSVIHDRMPGAWVDTPLHLAAQQGCPEVMEALLGHGMDVDVLSSGGFTTLAMAAELYCPLEVFQLLVAHGADIHVGDDAPLRNAIWQHAYKHWNYEEVIRYLVQQGSTPQGLHHCARAGNLGAVQLLMKLGADVNDTRDEGWPLKQQGFTPLDYCTGVTGEPPHPQVAQALRQRGGQHAAERT